MIKFENTEVVGFDHAIRGMRNPMNSWEKSDSSYYNFCEENNANPGYCDDRAITLYDGSCYSIGPNDQDLMKRLVKAGPSHRKFMRMITVYVDVTAPLYWWKEADTYKVGTTANSCSTMHKIAAKEFTLEDFSCEHLEDIWNDTFLYTIIDLLNKAREKYIETKDKKYWWQMIQLLPTSYNQRRTLMLNYEVLSAMYHQRKGHRLDEWESFRRWVEGLPYSELITGEFQEGDDQ